MTKEEIQSRITGSIPDAEVEVTDLTGTSDHWEIVVKSGIFKAKSPLEQHRLVYDALGHAGEADLHAVKLKTIPA